MGYHQEKNRQEQFSDAVETATNAANEVKLWISRFPEVKDIHANYSVIYSYFHGDLESINGDLDGTLDDCWNNHPKFREMLALWPSENDEKSSLSDKIIELLRPGTSPQNLKAEKDGHKYKSVIELRIRAGVLAEKAALRKMSTAEIRTLLQKPEPDKELPSDISAAQIKHMWTPENFRYWAKRLGSMEPINRRLREGN
jgi:hypothetical protein